MEAKRLSFAATAFLFGAGGGWVSRVMCIMLVELYVMCNNVYYQMMCRYD